MAAGMGSPERNSIVQNLDCQGSPFFHFLCSLSPIKPIRSDHTAAQSFPELSFPAPPSVFVSPKKETHTKRKILTSILDNTITAKKNKCNTDSSFLPYFPVENALTPAQQQHHLHQQQFQNFTSSNHTISTHGSRELYPIPTHVHNHEQIVQNGSNQQQFSCRAATAGIRRRCLDFETPEDQKRSLSHVSVLEIPLEEPCGHKFSNSSGIKNDFPTNCSSVITHTESGTYFFSQNTTENPTTFASTNADPPRPLLSELDMDPRDSELEIPRLIPSELSYKNPLTHSYPCIDESHKPLLGIGNLQGHVPVDKLCGNNPIHLNGNCYNVSGNNLDLEAFFSFVERIGINPQGVNKSIPCTAHVAGGMEDSCYGSATFNIECIENLKNNLFACGVAPQEISHHLHQSESDLIEDGLSHVSPECGPKKKRKLSVDDNTSGEGCKNCKCKKSKCLKLYCECFASGVYCVGGCRCSNCYNRPEFEDIVIRTREQIESRNPSAFVPKIVRGPVASPTSTGEDQCLDIIPMPTRHKRGCNCKKSQCSKKYCECYQAGVGCGEGCRCEGCQNIFGRNEADQNEQQKNMGETVTGTNEEEIIRTDSRPTPDDDGDDDDDRQCDQRNTVLSPLTPYLNEHSGQNVESQVKSGEPSPSPFILPALPTMSFNSRYQIFEALEGIQNPGRIQMNTQPNLSSLSNNLAAVSTCSDGLADIYSLHHPLPQLSEDDYNLYDRMNASQPYCQTNHGHLVPSGLPGIKSREVFLIEHSCPANFPPDNDQFYTRENDALAIPTTPLLPSSSNVARHNTYEDLDEMSEMPSRPSAWFSDEEKSPNVLHSLSAPEIVLKTQSPQQKRVFTHCSYTSMDSREIISPRFAFKNGRKFILHALPSSGSLAKPERLTQP